MENTIKYPKRFLDATSKLYVAFHSGELNAIDECACAVGNNELKNVKSIAKRVKAVKN